MMKLKEEVEKKGLKLSATEHRKEGRKEQDDCVVWLLGGRAASMQQGRVSDVGRQRGNAGCGLENKSQGVGSKSRSEKKEVQGEVLDYQEERSFPEKLHEGGRQEVVTCRHGVSKSMVSACSGDGSHGRVKIEETEGSSCG